MRVLLIALLLFCTTAALAGAGYKGLFAPSEDAPASTTPQATPSSPVLAPKQNMTPAPVVPPTVSRVPMPAAVPATTPLDTRLSDDQIRQLSQPRAKIEGMYPAEYMAKRETDKLRAGLKDGSIKPEDARKRLSTLEKGFRAKQSVPDSSYKEIGVPDVYVRDQKDGAAAALKIVEAMQKEMEGK